VNPLFFDSKKKEIKKKGKIIEEVVQKALQHMMSCVLDLKTF
jgi:hypothetical protein